MIGAARSLSRSLGWAWALAALGVLGMVTTAHATVMVEVPLERLVAEADLVAHARVLATGARLVQNAQWHFEPHSVAIVRLLEVIAGAPRASELVIDEIGGEVQGRAMRIAGTPEYRTGEEVVLFLRELPGGEYRTYAMAQGAFEVLPAVGSAERVVVRDTRTLSIARWAAGAMTLDHGTRAEMPLASFLDVLRAIAASLDEQGGAR
jgi:hypothetical protein